MSTLTYPCLLDTIRGSAITVTNLKDRSGNDSEVSAAILLQTVDLLDAEMKRLAFKTQRIIIGTNGEPSSQDWPVHEYADMSTYRVNDDRELENEARQFVQMRWPLIRWPDKDTEGWKVDVDGPYTVTSVPEYEWKVVAEGDGFVCGIWDNEIEDWTGYYPEMPRPAESPDEQMNEEEQADWRLLRDDSMLLIVLDEDGDRVYQNWHEDDAKERCRELNAEHAESHASSYPFIRSWAYLLDGDYGERLFTAAGATIAAYDSDNGDMEFANGTYAGDGTNVILRVFLLAACQGQWPVMTRYGYRYVMFKEE